MTEQKDPNRNAENMGGPSFHPDVADNKKAPKAGASLPDKKDGAILDEDQVPPL